MRSWIALTCIVCLPLRNLYVTSPYGYRLHPLTGKYAFHDGIDLRAGHDTVFAIMDGTVAACGYGDAIGLYIRLNHSVAGSIYGHLSQTFVAAGDSVRAGDAIGITGATGNVTGEHLHFAIMVSHRFINPLEFLYQTLIKEEYEQEF